MDEASEGVPSHASRALAQAPVFLDWGQVAEMDPSHVNQAMAQVGNPGPDKVPDGIYVSLGNVAPPITPPGFTAEQAAEELKETTVAIHVHGRFHMSRAVAGKLMRDLQRVTEQYDAAALGAKEE